MSSVNKIILVGRLTSDPDIKVTTDGTSLAKFTLAVDRPVAGAGVNKTDFINIVAWRNLAENIKSYCYKGMLTLVEGQIRIRTYDDDNNQRKWITEVEAQQVKFLENKNRNVQATNDPMAPIAQEIPNLEEKVMDQVKESDFDFNSELDEVEDIDIQFPPRFGEEIEEDIPY